MPATTSALRSGRIPARPASSTSDSPLAAHSSSAVRLAPVTMLDDVPPGPSGAAVEPPPIGSAVPAVPPTLWAPAFAVAAPTAGGSAAGASAATVGLRRCRPQPLTPRRPARRPSSGAAPAAWVRTPAALGGRGASLRPARSAVRQARPPAPGRLAPPSTLAGLVRIRDRAQRRRGVGAGRLAAGAPAAVAVPRSGRRHAAATPVRPLG